MTKYLRYVFDHKWHVIRAGLRLGSPNPILWPLWFWRLLIHDWTKFLPDEFIPYMRHDFTSEADDPAFDLAWNHHQKRNRHHYQYYILKNDDGTEQVLEMDAWDVQEMLADWASFSLKRGLPVTDSTWYYATKDKKRIHPLTTQRIESILNKKSSGVPADV